ncbi:Protein LAP2 [Folsomia candida]|uniref:Protein LAP2 n=1 Tax=Folsomia candida TaxID=158441 RepID=A0A226E6N9_FOLCA|nr:Protein LAP2 [Folsomia candida]
MSAFRSPSRMRLGLDQDCVDSLKVFWNNSPAITDVADTIKNCKNLVYFDLSMNHLTKLPEGISQLVNLEELFLNDTYLEFLHANFGRLTKLKVLELRENAIQTLPKSMSRLHHLQRLDIGQNDLADLPDVVGTLSSLTELWCDNNTIRSIPKFIGNLTKLNCLDASQNEIQGIAEEISKCTQLSDVTLNVNSLQSLPDSFTKLENISVLRLDCNSISYLPEEFGNLKNLQELSIVGNILKALPASMGLLRKLHTLYLDDNLLSSLPKEIGSCTSLTVLSLSKNRLKEIPSEVGHLSALKVFTLSGNLVVHLPVSILSITKLGALWLSESQSKPLLPLTSEIDPASGQHVLTCYLLPQLPYNGDEARKYIDESNDNPLPRRSKPSIKFLTDVEPVVIESNVNKRGLLRAPTPYPKELRALAKHASHIHNRQSKEHNGDIVNTDEPEYDGDYPEEQPSGSGDPKTSIASTRINSVQTSIDIPDTSSKAKAVPEIPVNSSYSAYQSNLLTSGASTSKVDYKSPLHGISSIDTIGLPGVAPANVATRSYSSTPSSSSSSYPQQLSTTGQSYISSQQNNHQDISDVGKNQQLDVSTAGSSQLETRFTGLPDGPDKSNRESYGVSATEMARKSPPPYHVAARRAAFFRSSGGAGGSGLGSPTPQDTQGHARASPIVGRIFPLPTTAEPYHSSTSSSTSPSVVSKSTDMNVASNRNTKSSMADDDEEVFNLNKTYTISKDIDDSDAASSSIEENLDKGGSSTLDLDKGTLDSKNLVKTIESALESVDKRTTEFLREDRWQDAEIITEQQQDDHRNNPAPPPLEGEVLYSNVGLNEETDHVDSKVKPKPIVPSGIPSSMFHTSKGPPAVPPKPSPLLSRQQIGMHHSPEQVINDTSLDVLPANVSSSTRSENHSKIPTFGLTYSNKFVNSHLPVTISSSGDSNNHHQQFHSTQSPPFVDQSLEAGKSYMNHDTTEKSWGSQTSSTSSIGGLNSRIPKTTSFQSPVKSSAVHNFSGQQQSQFQFKKPEILSPKPSIARTVNPSRIPSFGSADNGKTRDEITTTATSPSLANSTQKSSLVSPKFSSSSSTGNATGGGIITSTIVENRSMNSSSIPESNANSNLDNSITGTKISRFGEPSPEKHDLKRTGSGTRIPKFTTTADTLRTALPISPPHQTTNNVDNAAYQSENNNEADTSLSNIPTSGISRIPSLGKKPWIFGTHKNARVVAIEFKKINSLGFSVSEAPAVGHGLDGQGIYVVGTDTVDSTVKVGDKILQVDGIDVSNMGLEIVKKILSNCQENINLLVSRKS